MTTITDCLAMDYDTVEGHVHAGRITVDEWDAWLFMWATSTYRFSNLASEAARTAPTGPDGRQALYELEMFVLDEGIHYDEYRFQICTQADSDEAAAIRAGR